MSAMPDNESLLIEMDCAKCGRPSDRTLCDRCAATAADTAAAHMLGVSAWQEVVNHKPATQEDAVPEFGGEPDEIAPVVDLHGGTLTDALAEISTQGMSNAAVQGAGSLRGGQLAVVGFTSKEGYITAIRNGVAGRTHREYLDTLRSRYGMTTADLALLDLPGPMVPTALPNGAGIAHIPTGPSIFDKPKAERAFVVGPKAEEQERTVARAVTGNELVAGAAAEGHHAIVAWMGTSQTTRGGIVEALTKIGRQEWAPKAPNARAQAGSAINSLARNGLDVRAQRKGGTVGLESGQHVWTVGKVDHTGLVGEEYGEVMCRFLLTGDTLTYQGSDAIGGPVVTAFAARMAAETLKSGDVTSWLARTFRDELKAVRFGALGFLIPAVHVEAARMVCDAIEASGFGTGWVNGLPVATSDQLRDGIARGLTDEVETVLENLARERTTARVTKKEAIDAAMALTDWRDAHAKAVALSGDIGPKRIETFLRELREVTARIIAYGQVLGEERVDSARGAVRSATIQLETLRGEDYEGISARFSAVWDEIEHDAKRKGEVL